MWCVPWDWERCAWWTLEHDEGSSRCRQTKERVCRLAGCRHRLQGRGGAKIQKEIYRRHAHGQRRTTARCLSCSRGCPSPRPRASPRSTALRSSPAHVAGRTARQLRHTRPHSGRGRGRLRRWPHEDQMLRLGVDELGVRAHEEQPDGRQRDRAGEHLVRIRIRVRVRVRVSTCVASMVRTP